MRIGYIKGDPNQTASAHRLQGYQDALAEAGLAYDEALVQPGYFTYRSGLDAAESLLALPQPPTAIFASNSLMAIGAIKVAQKHGVDVPGDISMMGFDDIPEATIVSPSLTIVARDLPRIGRQAAEILFERMDGTFTGPGRFFHSEWRIVERDSVRSL